MRQLNTEIRQLNLAQLIINIDNAFQEGINRGVQGLFKRGFDPLKGFTRFADTAFLGIGQGIEEFLAKNSVKRSRKNGENGSFWIREGKLLDFHRDILIPI